MHCKLVAADIKAEISNTFHGGLNKQVNYKTLNFD